MITLLIIIFVIYLIIKACTPDKRDKEQMSVDISQLPQFSIKSKRLSEWDKLCNLAYDDGSILDIFTYENGVVTLKMRSGKILSSKLSDLNVRFEDVRGIKNITAKSESSVKVSFTIMSGLFTDDEWELIIRVLLLAGTTYGCDIFSNSYKNMKAATSILKIISKL